MGALCTCLGGLAGLEKELSCQEAPWAVQAAGVRGKAKSGVLWAWGCPEEAGWQGQGPRPRMGV